MNDLHLRGLRSHPNDLELRGFERVTIGFRGDVENMYLRFRLTGWIYINRISGMRYIEPTGGGSKALLAITGIRSFYGGSCI